jgi:hypothetical protein
MDIVVNVEKKRMKENMIKCRHKFRPRYDTRFPEREFHINASTGDIDDLKEEIYVCDICIKCGKVIKRED